MQGVRWHRDASIGIPHEGSPHLARTIVQRMEEELSGDECREVLTWNYHQIPIQAFNGHKERYERAKDIDEFLKESIGGSSKRSPVS